MRARAVARRSRSVAALALLWGLAGCDRPACEGNDRRPEAPVASLSCPGNTLCYQGACVRACTAGQERLRACASPGDCSGARPNCVAGFCSTCELGETCVPGLDLCQLVYTVPPPEPPPGPVLDLATPPPPRDAGVLDGGLAPRPDAGTDPGDDPTPVSHLLFLDLAREARFVGGAWAETSTLAVHAFDVRGLGPATWRMDRSPPEWELNRRVDGACALVELERPSPSPGRARFGEIRVDDSGSGGTGALERALTVVPDDEAIYRLVGPPLAQGALVLSDAAEGRSRAVEVSGSGAAITAGPWPSTLGRIHVPFRLEPSPETASLLSAPIVVGPSPEFDLQLSWVRAFEIAGMQIVLRLVGEQVELRCTQIEDASSPGRLRITAGLLAAFADLERPMPGSERRLLLERSSELQLPVPPASAPDAGPALRHRVVARVRHTFVGSVRF